MINGSYLRQLRLSRHCTLKQASAAAGCTASFISQVERGLKEPSLSTLRNLADFFGVSLVSFFQTTPSSNDGTSDADTSYYLVKRDMRRLIVLPELSVRCEEITNNGNPSAKSICPIHGAIYTLSPNCWISESLVKHPFDECVFILQGSLKAYIGEDIITVATGDCLYLYANTYHNFFNHCTEDCIVISLNG